VSFNPSPLLTVAPHAGAWIETTWKWMAIVPFQSHPMRVRGLKLTVRIIVSLAAVAPHAGAWIETNVYMHSGSLSSVAPHAGAWIETLSGNMFTRSTKSHPMRVRGLKQSSVVSWLIVLVAPHAGAWIETGNLGKSYCNRSRRTPCGCVD